MIFLAIISGCGIKANPVRQSDEAAKHRMVGDAREAPANH
jgi:hypothetical protein